MAKIMSNYGPLTDALRDMGIDPNIAERVVIDIQAKGAPIIHVQYIGDERVIDVIRALEGVEIKLTDREE